MKLFIIALFLHFGLNIAFRQNVCIHCKHFKNDKYSHPKFGKCALYPIVLEDDLVTGNEYHQKKDHQFCSIVRRTGGCGPEGRLYEPKENIL
jgi:hypothetical protein